MDAGARAAARAIWARGDYHAFATATVWDVGPTVVRACAVEPGQRVLDVAAGTGNTAIRAAEAGARVTACDITPEHFAAGGREAAARGVAVEWVEADAEDLPFADGDFDVVTSSFGVMFAPDGLTAAAELVRVCRPGGTIGLASFTPDGLASEFFGIVAGHMPTPPEGGPPLAWGDEERLPGLFDGRLASLEMSRAQYVERAASVDAYVQLFITTFGPVVALREALAGDPGRVDAFDRDLRLFAERASRGRPGGPVEYPYDYLLAVGRTAGH